MALQLGDVIGTLGGSGLDWHDFPAANLATFATNVTLADTAMVLLDPGEGLVAAVLDPETGSGWSTFKESAMYTGAEGPLIATFPAGDYMFVSLDTNDNTYPGRYAIVPNLEEL